MKFTLIVFVLTLGFAFEAQADPLLYVGPYVGNLSYNGSDGSSSKQNVLTYGGEVFGVLGHFALGADYLVSDLGANGTPTVSVHQVDQWWEGELRYLLWAEDFTPYALVTAGAVNQDVKTTLLGATEEASNTYFAPSVGLGFLGRFAGVVGFDLSFRYYQYSNVSGLIYGISIGYFPSF